jgi:hypothetical protein
VLGRVTTSRSAESVSVFQASQCGQAERVSGDHDHVGALAGGQRAGLVGEAEQSR